jgi:hypothetical protein
VSVTRRTLLKGAVAGTALAGLPGCGDPTPPLASGGPGYAPGRTPWRNWAGSVWCDPAARLAPAGEDEVVEALSAVSGPIRPVGAGHSFSPLVPTDGTLLSLDALSGLESVDAESKTAWVAEQIGGTAK